MSTILTHLKQGSNFLLEGANPFAHFTTTVATLGGTAGRLGRSILAEPTLQTWAQWSSGQVSSLTRGYVNPAQAARWLSGQLYSVGEAVAVGGLSHEVVAPVLRPIISMVTLGPVVATMAYRTLFGTLTSARFGCAGNKGSVCQRFRREMRSPHGRFAAASASLTFLVVFGSSLVEKVAPSSLTVNLFFAGTFAGATALASQAASELAPHTWFDLSSTVASLLTTAYFTVSSIQDASGDLDTLLAGAAITATYVMSGIVANAGLPVAERTTYALERLGDKAWSALTVVTSHSVEAVRSVWYRGQYANIKNVKMHARLISGRVDDWKVLTGFSLGWSNDLPWSLEQSVEQINEIRESQEKMNTIIAEGGFPMSPVASQLTDMKEKLAKLPRKIEVLREAVAARVAELTNICTRDRVSGKKMKEADEELRKIYKGTSFLLKAIHQLSQVILDDLRKGFQAERSNWMVSVDNNKKRVFFYPAIDAVNKKTKELKNKVKKQQQLVFDKSEDMKKLQKQKWPGVFQAVVDLVAAIKLYQEANEVVEEVVEFSMEPFDPAVHLTEALLSSYWGVLEKWVEAVKSFAAAVQELDVPAENASLKERIQYYNAVTKNYVEVRNIYEALTRILPGYTERDATEQSTVIQAQSSSAEIAKILLEVKEKLPEDAKVVEPSHSLFDKFFNLGFLSFPSDDDLEDMSSEKGKKWMSTLDAHITQLEKALAASEEKDKAVMGVLERAKARSKEVHQQFDSGSDATGSVEL